MALTEKQEYKVEVIPPYSILQVRRAEIILKDGEEVARSYHRHVLNPVKMSGEAPVVQQVANGVWTPEACALYQEEVRQPMIDAAKAEAKAAAEEAAARAKAAVEAAAQKIKDAAAPLPAPPTSRSRRSANDCNQSVRASLVGVPLPSLNCLITCSLSNTSQDLSL